MKRIPPPVIEGLSRKYFYKIFTIGVVLSVIGAEAYWHGYVMPNRRKRDKYFEHYGIEFERL